MLQQYLKVLCFQENIKCIIEVERVTHYESEHHYSSNCTLRTVFFASLYSVIQALFVCLHSPWRHTYSTYRLLNLYWLIDSKIKFQNVFFHLLLHITKLKVIALVTFRTEKEDVNIAQNITCRVYLLLLLFLILTSSEVSDI